jgi:hypothetical protein
MDTRTSMSKAPRCRLDCRWFMISGTRGVLNEGTPAQIQADVLGCARRSAGHRDRKRWFGGARDAAGALIDNATQRARRSRYACVAQCIMIEQVARCRECWIWIRDGPATLPYRARAGTVRRGEERHAGVSLRGFAAGGGQCNVYVRRSASGPLPDDEAREAGNRDCRDDADNRHDGDQFDEREGGLRSERRFRIEAQLQALLHCVTR